MHRLVAWAVIALLLCGCSGAPSDGDIKAALQAEQRQKAANVAGLPSSGGMLRPITGPALFEVVSIRKRSCKAEGQEAYRCDVEMEIRKDNQTFKGTLVSLRLVRGNDGWSAQR